MEYALSKGKKPGKEVAVAMSPQLMQKNAILNGLEERITADVVRHGIVTSLVLRQQIYEPNKAIKDVYFPLDCVLSVVTRMRDGHQIEIGTIGREGMSAFPLLMGASSTDNDSYCQVRGSAIVISVHLFRKLTAASEDLRQRLDRYMQAYVNMLGQLAACNRLHTVYERCARWLLMTNDRVDVDEIPLTHEYLAMMLGTGRSGVTIAVGTLQSAGFIKNGYLSIAIVDRAGLESASCECYAIARRQFGGALRNVAKESIASDARHPHVLTA